MVCEGADLEANPGGVPRRVQARGERVDRVVEVDGEVEQAAGREHAREFACDARGVFGVIHDVVAQNHVEGGVGEGQALARGGDCLRAALPRGEERGVVARERVTAHAARRPEEEDEPVRAAPDFEHARVPGDGSHALKLLADACGTLAHRLDVILFVTHDLR